MSPKDVDAIKTKPRGKDSDPTEAQIRQLDHPSFNERLRAQEALALRDAGRGFDDSDRRSSTIPKTPELARRHLVWVVDAIAGGTPEGTAPLTAALRSPSADVRAQAARALGERAVASAESPLIALLKDPEAPVRLQAIIALGRIGKPAAVARLIPFTADPDVHLAYSARKALERIGDWREIARGLASPDAKVREGVLLTMERVYDRRAAWALARFAESAEHPVSAERAKAAGLPRGGGVHRKAPPWDGKWWGTQPWPGTKRWPRRSPGKGRRWCWRRSTSSSTIRPQPSAWRPSRRWSRPATRSRSPTFRTAQQLVSDPSPEVRVAIASAFGRMGDADSLPVLTSVLRDSKVPGSIRDAALGAVETIGSAKAVNVLLELLVRREGWPPTWLGRIVVAALGRFKDPSAIAPLVKLLKHPEAKLRVSIVDSLAAIGAAGKDKQRELLGPALRPTLADPSPEVRNRAIAALGSFEDRSAIPALIVATDDEPTRFEAIRALAVMPDIRAFQAYLREAWPRRAQTSARPRRRRSGSPPRSGRPLLSTSSPGRNVSCRCRSSPS